MFLEVVLAVLVLVLSAVLWTLNKSRRINIKELEVNGTRRPLGYFEKFMVRGFGPNSNIAHACIIFSKRPLSSAQVQKAAQMLTDRYQLLRSCVDKTDPEKPYFAPMDNFRVPMETVTSTTSWQDVYEECLTVIYNLKRGPLWCLKFLPKVEYKVIPYCDVKDSNYPHQSAVVFGFHHVMIDGCSRIRLANHFLTFLDDVIKGVETRVEPMKMLPAMEYYIADEITPGLLALLMSVGSKLIMAVPGVRSLCLALFGKKNMYTERFGMEEERNPNVEQKTCIIPMEFSREDTSRLLARCRENKATIHGAVQASVSLALAKLFQEGEVTEEISLPVACTINLRPFIKGSPVPADCLGTYFMPLFIQHTVKPLHKMPDDFWKMASRTTEQVKFGISGRRLYDFIKFFKCFFHLSLNKDSRYPVLSALTNLGNCSFLDRSLEADVKFRAMHSCTDEHEAGPIFAARVVTFNGQMFFTICYYTNVTTKERAMEFANSVRETLKAALM